ncbi:MAG TPA: superoxide dismutase [Vicinamibacteria bacterium]|nr:superoxide dismutase [Vicinamibacteria bacterium]
MTYQPKNFSSLLGMRGFSDGLLKDHFGLYEGYVSQTNELLEKTRRLSETGLDSAEFSELKRRLGWEFNGMRLHELYFANLGGRGGSPRGELLELLKRTFGSFEAWNDEFQAVGSMRGVGWAISYYDPNADQLLNLWIDEHDTYHAAGCTPLIVMDVWEHAFAKDYGTNRASYITAFMENVDWNVVESRLAAAASEVSASR